MTSGGANWAVGKLAPLVFRFGGAKSRLDTGAGAGAAWPEQNKACAMILAVALFLICNKLAGPPARLNDPADCGRAARVSARCARAAHKSNGAVVLPCATTRRRC